jgi:hypothetical protein
MLKTCSQGLLDDLIIALYIHAHCMRVQAYFGVYPDEYQFRAGDSKLITGILQDTRNDEPTLVSLLYRHIGGQGGF